MKIAIAGIGGVGGYFGGLLARYYENHADIEIYFVARGQHLSEIQNHGLRVIYGTSEFLARPKLATDNPSEIGEADFIFICTKSYDLPYIMEQLRPCIGRNTVVIPLLNGVDSRGRIMQMFPDNEVLDGCVYLVSKVLAPGVVENSGNIEKLFFGKDGQSNETWVALEKVLQAAGVDAQYSDAISSVVWEKFIFISPLATATSYYNVAVKEIHSDPEKMELFTALLHEINTVASAKQIVLPEGIEDITITKLKGVSPGATSSMQRDFQGGKGRTELESLSGYVLRAAREFGIDTPAYTMAYNHLKKQIMKSEES